MYTGYGYCCGWSWLMAIGPLRLDHWPARVWEPRCPLSAKEINEDRELIGVWRWFSFLLGLGCFLLLLSLETATSGSLGLCLSETGGLSDGSPPEPVDRVLELLSLPTTVFAGWTNTCTASIRGMNCQPSWKVFLVLQKKKRVGAVWKVFFGKVQANWDMQVGTLLFFFFFKELVQYCLYILVVWFTDGVKLGCDTRLWHSLREVAHLKPSKQKKKKKKRKKRKRSYGSSNLYIEHETAWSKNEEVLRNGSLSPPLHTRTAAKFRANFFAHKGGR